MIECRNDEEISKLLEEIESNEALQDDLEFHHPVKKNPKIIIYRFEEDLDPDAALKLIKDQNEELRESEVKHEYLMKTPRGDNWIISLDPKSFRKIMETGKINIGWYRINLREYIRPRQCFQCFKFDHVAKKCLK
ncbi:hypothetical protein AVEN_174564-1 [Araneus ventricosus]|uniref:CCHC-type domain-containing protein n=1 Tax=Araneus ventricosus TaxID=182803 RepID=A0A4Y2UWI4_ARAVE|nr:hypothetical protein AVEN_174564-1 [Araneus ventricosus]